MRQRDWKDPFSWFNWYQMKKDEVPLLYQFQGGVDPRYGLSSFPAGTFARADASTCATYIDGNGVVQTVAANIPRYQHYVSGNGPTLLYEGVSSTNACLQSNAYTTTWTTSGTVTSAQNQTDPAGSASSAWTLGDNDGAVIADFRQAVAVANDSTKWTHSVFLKKTSGAASFPGIGIIYTGGSAALVQATINTDTGVGTIRTGSTAGATVSVQSISSTYWRAWVTIANDSSGNTSARLAYYPAVNTDGSATWAAATTGTAVFAFSMFENASVPSSYIATTTTAVSRAADSLSFPFSATPQAMTVYGDAYALEIYETSAAKTWWWIGASGATTAPYLYANVDNAGGRTLKGGHNNNSAEVTSNVTTAFVYADRTETRIALSGTGTILAGLSVNGASESLGSESATNTLAAAWAGLVLTVGARGGASLGGNFALRSLKIAAGVQSLSAMRGA